MLSFDPLCTPRPDFPDDPFNEPTEPDLRPDNVIRKILGWPRRETERAEDRRD